MGSTDLLNFDSSSKTILFSERSEFGPPKITLLNLENSFEAILYTIPSSEYGNANDYHYTHLSQTKHLILVGQAVAFFEEDIVYKIIVTGLLLIKLRRLFNRLRKYFKATYFGTFNTFKNHRRMGYFI